MILAVIIFWVSTAAMFHSYILYPWLLRILAIGKKQNDSIYDLKDQNLPNVYVVFAVYNEQKVIREKIESIFNTSYPTDKIQVYIGSDNSTDNTNAIVDEFATQYNQKAHSDCE